MKTYELLMMIVNDWNNDISQKLQPNPNTIIKVSDYFIKGKDRYTYRASLDTINNHIDSVEKTSLTLEEAQEAAAIKLIKCMVNYAFAQLIDKTPYINGELGVIAIDEITGHKIYEDKVHRINEDTFRYYIQSDPVGSFYVVPEREDIPEKHWGDRVTNRWIIWKK